MQTTTKPLCHDKKVFTCTHRASLYPCIVQDGTLWEDIGVDSSIKVKSVELVHRQGNNYSGIVTVDTNIGGYITEEKYTLNVVYDGFKFVWQINNIIY